MACTDPNTRSPGILFLRYIDTTGQNAHTCGVHFLAGVDPSDITNHRLLAQLWAEALAAVVTNVVTFTDCGARDVNGHIIWETPLLTPVTGAHARDGQENWKSQTVDFEGHGRAFTGICTGKTRFKVFVYGAYRFTPGMKYLDGTVATDLNDVADFLNSSAIIGADYYGQKANFKAQFPVQWNARAQRHQGS